jgi:hypothetical protein
MFGVADAVVIEEERNAAMEFEPAIASSRVNYGDSLREQRFELSPPFRDAQSAAGGSEDDQYQKEWDEQDRWQEAPEEEESSRQPDNEKQTIACGALRLHGNTIGVDGAFRQRGGASPSVQTADPCSRACPHAQGVPRAPGIGVWVSLGRHQQPRPFAGIIHQTRFHRILPNVLQQRGVFRFVANQVVVEPRLPDVAHVTDAGEEFRGVGLERPNPFRDGPRSGTHHNVEVVRQEARGHEGNGTALALPKQRRPDEFTAIALERRGVWECPENEVEGGFRVRVVRKFEARAPGKWPVGHRATW